MSWILFVFRKAIHELGDPPDLAGAEIRRDHGQGGRVENGFFPCQSLEDHRLRVGRSGDPALERGLPRDRRDVGRENLVIGGRGTGLIARGQGAFRREQEGRSGLGSEAGPGRPEQRR